MSTLRLLCASLVEDKKLAYSDLLREVQWAVPLFGPYQEEERLRFAFEPHDSAARVLFACTFLDHGAASEPLRWSALVCFADSNSPPPDIPFIDFLGAMDKLNKYGLRNRVQGVLGCMLDVRKDILDAFACNAMTPPFAYSFTATLMKTKLHVPFWDDIPDSWSDFSNVGPKTLLKLAGILKKVWPYANGCRPDWVSACLVRVESQVDVPVSVSDIYVGDFVQLQYFMLPKTLKNKHAVITKVLRKTVHVVVFPGTGTTSYTHIKKHWCKLLVPSALRSFYDMQEVASSSSSSSAASAEVAPAVATAFSPGGASVSS